MKKLLTFYSKTHKVLYDNFFIPSYEKYISNEYKLITKKIDQVCTSGEFASIGFDYVMLQKIKFIIDNIDINDEDPLIFSDCDVQFFSNLNFNLSDYDILFQHDFYPNARCAGLFVCKQNKKILSFFQLIEKNLTNNLNKGTDDQGIINRLLDSGYSEIKSGLLPNEEWWTVGMITNGSVWNGQFVQIPKNIKVHHANFTIGVNNKIKLMELVKSKTK